MAANKPKVAATVYLLNNNAKYNNTKYGISFKI